MTENSVTLLACGDIGPIYGPTQPYTVLAKPVLEAADIRIGQVERVYSERGSLQVHAGGGHSRLKPEMASVFAECGLDVATIASNHSMDWGWDALSDTIDVLRAKGIQTVGAGANREEACKPVFLDRNGIRIAFLAYCSVLNEGYAATAEKPGVAPLRAHTFYEPFEYQPGIPPRVVTVPYEQDLEGMVKDIGRARQEADAVVLSLHWGVHYIPRLIADYQPVAAKVAFAAGADVIFGHHAHVPKAVGVYDGKACFYSLSNFIMNAPKKSPEKAAQFELRYGVKLDPDYPNLGYGEDAKRSLIGKAILTRQGVRQTSFLPVLIDRQYRPEVLRHGDPRFDDMVRYMEWASEKRPHRFEVRGDEVLVT
jgi:poly-gamma-glutamate synthesis protein (capsule biosynthesis protein)